MTYRLSAVSSITWSAAVAVLLASACGGNSFSKGGDDPQGGSSSTAGASNGTSGKPTTAGSHSGGSVGTGGASTTGGAGSTAGAGGSAGSEACSAVPDSGNCDAYIERWYHDPYTGLCRGFVYGGCGGNDNNYGSFEECQMACPGGSPNYDECSKPTDCMVSGAGCCGICDGPDVTARDLLAYNRKYAGQVVGCGGVDTPGAPGAAPPGDIACAPCPPVMGDEGTLKYFVPNCVHGACVAEDVRASSVSLCESDMDCVLRNGNGCCQSCSGAEIISVNTSDAFSKLVCGDVPPLCSLCGPDFPANVRALCNPEGHCEVLRSVGAK